EALWLLTDQRAVGGPDNLAVDQSTVDRGLAWLRAAAAPAPVLPGVAPTSIAAVALPAQVHALYVLSLYGAADHDLARQLIAATTQLTPPPPRLSGGTGLEWAAQGWLALTLERLNAHDE